MQRLIEYIGHHYYLAGAVVLAVLGVIVAELKERVSGFAALSAMQAVRLMNQGALVLDLRPKEAFEEGHIGEARNIPASELESSADSLRKWRDRAVITYCDTGVAAASAVRTLTKLGFTKVFNLQGGLNAWVKDNLPLTKGSSGKSGAK
jgi:rhodanese-related sulfurtransferase